MDVKPGYKQTEVGVIPEDWEVRRLSDLAELLSSKRIFESDYVSMGVSFYRGTEITLLIENRPLPKEYFISEARYGQIQRKYGVPGKGDILITAVGTLGNVYLVPDDSRFYFKDGNLIWLRGVNAIDGRYLAIQLRNRNREIVGSAIGSTQKALTIVSLKETLLPLPPTKAEQEAIAEALSDADALIESLEQLLTKKRQIKKGAMQELLTGKKRLPGFSGEWKPKRLGEVSEIVMGQSPSSAHYNNKGEGLPLIQGNADISGRQTIRRVFTTEVTKRGYPGDVLISVRAPVGEISRTGFDVCLGRGVCAIRCPENDFLYYALTAREQAWARLSKGSTFDSVSSTDVEQFEIEQPTDETEQHAIATILSDMDAEITALEAKLAKARQFKQGMMQELLTGRIRLV